MAIIHSDTKGYWRFSEGYVLSDNRQQVRLSIAMPAKKYRPAIQFLTTHITLKGAFTMQKTRPIAGPTVDGWLAVSTEGFASMNARRDPAQLVSSTFSVFDVCFH